MTATVAAVRVTCEVRIVDLPTFPVEKFHERGEAFMDQLMCLEDADADVTDMSLAGDAGRSAWTIDMTITTDDEFDALMRALAVIRAALHELGDATPGWPTADEIRTAFAPAGMQTERTLVPA